MTPLGLEVRHIEMLEALLNESHVSRAAERLALSQPAVSNALAQMRLHFGDELLVRQGSRMVLTPFAEILREQVGSILRGIRTLAAARPSFAPAASDRRFRMAMPPHVGALVMPALIRHCAEAAPDVRIDCVPLSTAWGQFDTGEIDLLLCNINMLPPGTPHAMVMEDHWRCLVAEGTNIPGGVLSAEVLTSLRLVVPAAELQRPMPQLGLDLARSATVPMELIPHVVAQGGAASIVPASFAQFHQLSLPLQSYTLPVPTPTIRCVIAWPLAQAHDPANRWLRDQVLAAAEPASRRLAALGDQPAEDASEAA